MRFCRTGRRASGPKTTGPTGPFDRPGGPCDRPDPDLAISPTDLTIGPIRTSPGARWNRPDAVVPTSGRMSSRCRYCYVC